MSEVYTSDFYTGHMAGSVSSAAAIVPLVLSLFPVKSVVDVGCGVGGWLAEFARNGVADIRGVDGDYVDRSLLKIPADRFTPRDLSQLASIGARFDLACSLEVAEHLPQARAEAFVAALADSAPVVLFSAAAPGQGGDDHINEQWPSYWARLFGKHGFVTLDCIRPKIVNDPRVEWWYRQNILVFCKPERVPAGHAAETNLDWLDRAQPHLVHLLINERNALRDGVDAEGKPHAAFFARLPWRIELEIAKFLCSIGLTRDGEILWRRATARRK